MTIDEARDCAQILANAYGMGSRRVGWYADMLERFPAGPTALFLEDWVERERVPPTVAVIKAGVRERARQLQGASPTFEPRSERMEKLVVWRSLIEDQECGDTRDRLDAFDQVRWMNPPCQQAEWREARLIADQRWKERNEQLVKEGKPPRPPRPSLAYPEPPGEPAPQRILSRRAHQAGFAAIFAGLNQKLDREHMVAKVLGAIRAIPESERYA